MVSAISSDHTAPIIATSGLRNGATKSGHGGHWHTTRALTTTAEMAPGRQVLTRADSAFCNHKKDERIECRLVVRRVKRLPSKPGQEALLEPYRFHAFITNSTPTSVGADQRHRGHAIIEHVIAERKNGPLTHLPSGDFDANSAWLGFATIAFNLSRAAGHAAGMHTERMPTIRDRIIAVPAQLAKSARKVIAHMPLAWPFEDQWARLWARATGPQAHLEDLTTHTQPRRAR